MVGRRALEQIEGVNLTVDSKDRLLTDAFRHASWIEDADERATSMALLAPIFQVLLRSEIRRHKDARATDAWQSRVLKELGPHLRPEQLPQALSFALHLPDDYPGNRFSAIGALASPLAQLSAVDLYPLWRTTVRTLSLNRRENMLQHLKALTPIVVRLGGTSAAIQTTKAVEICGEWWP